MVVTFAEEAILGIIESLNQPPPSTRDIQAQQAAQLERLRVTSTSRLGSESPTSVYSSDETGSDLAPIDASGSDMDESDIHPAFRSRPFSTYTPSAPPSPIVMDMPRPHSTFSDYPRALSMRSTVPRPISFLSTSSSYTPGSNPPLSPSFNFWDPSRTRPSPLSHAWKETSYASSAVGITTIPSSLLPSHPPPIPARAASRPRFSAESRTTTTSSSNTAASRLSWFSTTGSTRSARIRDRLRGLWRSSR